MMHRPILLASLLAMLSCSHSGTDPLPTPSLDFHIAPEATDSSDQVVVDSREPPIAMLWNPDGTNLKLVISAEERSSLFALFENPELAGIYGQDSAENDPDSLEYTDSPGPDCTEIENDIQTICQALKIASVRATGSASLSPPAVFYFHGPTNLSIETARMLITLDELRQRIREHGEPIEAN